MPASSVGASFSSMPHTGKLNALMWIAAPSSGTQMCWPMNVPVFDSTFDVAIHVDAAVRQLARAARCIREQRADAAVDVDPGIGLGGAGRIRQRVELVLAIGQELRHALEQRRALVESELPQRRPALAARVLQHAREIDAARRSLGDDLSRRRVAQHLRVALSCMPAALHIALQLHRILLSRHAACACR